MGSGSRHSDRKGWDLVHESEVVVEMENDLANKQHNLLADLELLDEQDCCGTLDVASAMDYVRMYHADMVGVKAHENAGTQLAVAMERENSCKPVVVVMAPLHTAGNPAVGKVL